MAHDPTPPLSPAISIGSTDSLVTPNHSDTSTFVDVSEGTLDDSFLRNPSEVWEDFKDDPFSTGLGIQIADAGIPPSPSPSLLSGMDLLEDTTPPPHLPDASVRTRRTAGPRRVSSFDFPSPPILVLNKRMTRTFRESASINGNPPVIGLVSHPGFRASHDCLPQPTRISQPSASQHWSIPPSATFHPDRGSRPFFASKSTGTLLSWPANHAATDRLLDPGDAGHAMPSPARHSKRQETPDGFTSFIDMSVNEPTLSTSRIHRLFSKLSGRLKSRNGRH
jgi:hypothetical protein